MLFETEESLIARDKRICAAFVRTFKDPVVRIIIQHPQRAFRLHHLSQFDKSNGHLAQRFRIMAKFCGENRQDFAKNWLGDQKRIDPVQNSTNRFIGLTTWKRKRRNVDIAVENDSHCAARYLRKSRSVRIPFSFAFLVQ